MTLSGWLRLLRDNRFDVDLHFWPRVTTISILSICNSLYGFLEGALYREEIERTVIEPPLFILGRWRSGTTHLHNLLSLDERFAFPNFYQVRFPHTFLLTEGVFTRLARSLLPEKRSQDDVRIGWKMPSEDELALGAIILRSFFIKAVFPRRRDFYIRYASLRDVPPRHVEEWKEAMIFFFKKLSFKYRRPLIIKSPEHMSRISLLVGMFPGARFVHIHRHPYQVYQSGIGARRATKKYRALQDVGKEILDDEASIYQSTFFDPFFEERDLIPRGHFHEISYEELDRDPLGILRGIYEGLELGSFERVEPSLRRYLGSLGSYRKNVYPEIPAEVRERLVRDCPRCFEEWGYRT